MRIHHIGVLFGFAIFWVSVEFFGALGGANAALVAAIFTGLCGSLAARYFSILEDPPWMLPLVLASSSLAGLGIAFLQRSFAPFEWMAALFCFIVSGVVVLVQIMNRRRCGLCARRLAGDALTFTCPRCALVVCDERCWNFEHRRCQLCVDQRVPMLSTQNQWWDRNLGPTAVRGRCQVCMTSYQEVDLRSCGRCRRPQCRSCWDNQNGECARCGWIVPDLPPSLRVITASYGKVAANAAAPRHNES